MKCAKCGKRIQYNRYKKVKGKYYCPECVPKKQGENYTAFKKFEVDMNEVSKIVTPTKKAKEDVESFGVTTDELSAAVDTVGTGASVKYADPPKEIKPRKKYKKRKVKKDGVMIRKVKTLNTLAKEEAEKQGFSENDLVIVRTVIGSLPAYEFTKIEGSPTQFLKDEIANKPKKKYKKRKAKKVE